MKSSQLQIDDGDMVLAWYVSTHTWHTAMLVYHKQQ